MASGCISSCVDARAPVRATYVNLYKCPESDVDFMKAVTRGSSPKVVDSYSCRQLYLRSYPFSKEKESMHVQTKKCFGQVKQKVVRGSTRKGGRLVWIGRNRRFLVMRKVRAITCAALWCRLLRKLLSCTTKVDVE